MHNESLAYVHVLTGLGVLAGITMGTLLVALLALPFVASTALEHWHPTSLLLRVIGGIRTLGVLAVAVTIFVPLMGGGGGAGVLIFQEGWRLADHSQVFGGSLIAIIPALAIDIFLGAVQSLLPLASRSHKGM